MPQDLVGADLTVASSASAPVFVSLYIYEWRFLHALSLRCLVVGLTRRIIVAGGSQIAQEVPFPA
jgi:hypothetical protein